MYCCFRASKASVVWGMGAAFALLGGVDTPLEMPQLFLAAATSFKGMWRNWHASWNLWFARYIYMPRHVL